MTKIAAELTAGTQVSISNGRHTWRADEPPEAKGTDLAPNPYELLLGALAACTCITLSPYCQHKGIALKSVAASYEFRRVQAEDCEGCEDVKGGKVEQVTSHIRMAGDFDEKQKDRLAQIAERCPVHRTLAGGLHLVDRVEFA
jgi:putative redox protein